MSLNALLSVHLGVELKQRWVNHCSQNGTTPSAGVRQVIRHLLIGDSAMEAAPRATSEREQSDTSRRRLELRLTGSEFSKIDALSHTLEMSVNQWVINLIRANLSAEPQFGMAELRVLGESNSRLLAIGRNLNQIARQVNAHGAEHSRFKVEQIEALSKCIESHTADVSIAIRANIDRWRLK